jgi:hypothetical protein
MHLPGAMQFVILGDQVMRILGILALVLALVGCTGDRLRQGANEHRQAVVPI